MKFDNTTFYGYIRVLLIKTNSMVYICYIKYGGNADICVLAVGDDELSMGTSWGTAESGESRGWVLVCSSHARNAMSRRLGCPEARSTCHEV